MILLPVSVTYDRIFEMNNLSSEMISGEMDEPGIIGIADKLRTLNKDQLGRIFVNFAEPISMREYLAKRDVSSLDHVNLFDTSL